MATILWLPLARWNQRLGLWGVKRGLKYFNQHPPTANKMSSYKLSYFPLRGRAEVSRLVLLAAGKKFEDNRIPPTEWPAIKSSTPFGSLPVLEVDGQSFGQGIAIATFLARENGLYGSTNLEGIQIDQIHQLREDLLIEEVKVFKEKDETKLAEMKKNMADNVYPRIVGYFNSLIKENQAKNNGSKYTVGKSLTLADIIVFEGTTNLVESNAAALDIYPEVKAVRELVSNHAQLKPYLEKRAKSPL